MAICKVLSKNIAILMCIAVILTVVGISIKSTVMLSKCIRGESNYLMAITAAMGVVFEYVLLPFFYGLLLGMLLRASRGFKCYETVEGLMMIEGICYC